MLKSLHIKNFVLIDEVNVEFAVGLNIITGETGSGKSVLLDALGLALGDRGVSGAVRSGEKQASITAVFDVSGNLMARKVLQEQGIEIDDELYLRRALSTDGKSRAFINDTPATIASLKAIGDLLVESQSQHEQFTLSDNVKVRALLDDFAGNAELLKRVAVAYQAYSTIQKSLQETESNIKAAEREREYLRFVHKELSSLSVQIGEEVELAEKKANFAGRKRILDSVSRALDDLRGSKPVYSAIASAQKALARTGNPALDSAIAALDKSLNEVSDAERLIEAFLNDGDDETNFERIDDRLHAIRAAARKYGMPADELPALLNEAEEKLQLSEDGEQLIKKLLVQIESAKNDYLEVAKTLSETRIKAAAKLEKAIMKELALLKMEKAVFKIDVSAKPENEFTESGVDDVIFLAATIAGSNLQAISKIASGGELSRIMLAIKSTLTSGRQLPTIVFDEIDTGISGAVADAVGQKLAALSEKMQVIVVTHQPQVAAKGAVHFVISKDIKAGKTYAIITRLTNTQREEEVARMLSGSTITTEARAAAARLLEKV